MMSPSKQVSDNNLRADNYMGEEEPSKQAEDQQVDHLEEEVYRVEDEIEQAEKDEFEHDQAQIATAMTTATNRFSSVLSHAMKDHAGVIDLQSVTSEVKNKLEEEASSQFQQRATDILDEEMERFEAGVEQDRKEGYGLNFIKSDMVQSKQAVVSSMRQEMHDAAADVSSNVLSRAQQIELQILEDRLSQKLGKTVKLHFVEDDIQGIDDLFTGLPNLGGSVGGDNPVVRDVTPSPPPGNDDQSNDGDDDYNGDDNTSEGDDDAEGDDNTEGDDDYEGDDNAEGDDQY